MGQKKKYICCMNPKNVSFCHTILRNTSGTSCLCLGFQSMYQQLFLIMGRSTKNFLSEYNLKNNQWYIFITFVRKQWLMRLFKMLSKVPRPTLLTFLERYWCKKEGMFCLHILLIRIHAFSSVKVPQGLTKQLWWGNNGKMQKNV